MSDSPLRDRFARIFPAKTATRDSEELRRIAIDANAAFVGLVELHPELFSRYLGTGRAGMRVVVHGEQVDFVIDQFVEDIIFWRDRMRPFDLADANPSDTKLEAVKERLGIKDEGGNLRANGAG